MDFIKEFASPLLNEPIVLFIFISFLLYAGVRDFQTKLIRDKLNLFFLSTAIVLMVLTGLSDAFAFETIRLEFGWSNIAGLVMGFLFLFIPAFIKNQPMGGDIKISAVVGFWLGYEAMIGVLLIATFANMLYWVGAFYVYKDFGSKTLMPFAPFIAIGALVFYGTAYFL